MDTGVDWSSAPEYREKGAGHETELQDRHSGIVGCGVSVSRVLFDRIASGGHDLSGTLPTVRQYIASDRRRVLGQVQVRYYGYNGFVVEGNEYKVVIDPGGDLYLLRMRPVIPRTEWNGVTHIVVTHGDPDHCWHVDRVAEASGAPVICGTQLVERHESRWFLASPRARKLEYTTPIERVVPMQPGEATRVEGIDIRAIRTEHGPLRLSMLFGLIHKEFTTEADERFALGATGFVLDLDGVRIATLGDSIMLPEWQTLSLDVLIIPIGGRKAGNTMDEEQAVAAVALIRPRLVIPCHYNCGFLFRRTANPADTERFRAGVEALGVRCAIMVPGDELDYSSSDSDALP